MSIVSVIWTMVKVTVGICVIGVIAFGIYFVWACLAVMGGGYI